MKTTFRNTEDYMSTNKPKITPGKWTVKTYADGSQEIQAGGDAIAFCIPPEKAMSPIPGEEPNTLLIAEAGTVANQTGLWPREMAEQRNLLLDACRLLYDEMGKRISPAAFDEFSEEAKDLLKKALAAAAPPRPTAPKP